MEEILAFIKAFVEAEAEAHNAEVFEDLDSYHQKLKKFREFIEPDSWGYFFLDERDEPFPEDERENHDPSNPRYIFRLDRLTHPVEGEIWSVNLSDVEAEMFQLVGYANRFLIRPKGESWEIFSQFFWEEMADEKGRWLPGPGIEIKIADLSSPLETHLLEEPVDDEASLKRWKSKLP